MIKLNRDYTERQGLAQRQVRMLHSKPMDTLADVGIEAVRAEQRRI